MMELLKWLLQQVTDKNISFDKKMIVTTFIITVLFLVNDNLGFTRYYEAYFKVDMINRIEEIKNKAVNNAKLIEVLNKEEQQILDRKPLLEKFREWTLRENKSISNTHVAENDSSFWDFLRQPRRSLFLHVVTSTLLLILLDILLLIVSFCPFAFVKYVKDNQISLKGLSLGAFMSAVIITAIIWGIQFVWGLVPVLFGSAYINYAIPLIVQALLVIGISKYIKKNRDRNLEIQN
jgi:hypothetical protein